MDSKTILLIDDEIDIRKLTKIVLEGAGYKVTTAFRGKRGIKKAKKGKIDLIILDVMMPDMDGYEVIKNLNQDKATKNIPVVFFSAKTQKKEIEKGLSLGARGYLTKPFDPEEFPQKIRKFISKTERGRNS